MSNELLQKVIDTTNLGTSGSDLSGDGRTHSGTGLLYPDQANRFLDYMWDATILAKAARTIRMRSNTTEIDRVSVGQRLMTVAAEDNPRDYYNFGDGTGGTYPLAAATFSKISLTTRKLRLDWELSAESLEDNIEGPDLEDHIARLMATQAGNDIEDTLINGVGASGSGLMSAFVGFRANAIANAHVVDGNAQGLDKAVFNTAIKTLPRKYKQRRNQLRFFVGSNLVQDYLYNLTSNAGSANPWDIASGVIRGDVVANDGGPGSTTPFAFGIPVINVPLMDETRDSTGKAYGDSGYNASSGLFGDVHLTFPQNFIVGIKRDVVVYRLFQPKKDTIEYTLFIRVGCAFENFDAHVIVKNVKVGGSSFGTLGSVTHGSLVSNSDTNTRGTF
jgi:Phage capsid family